MIYRIVTEDKSMDKEISELVKIHFNGFSIHGQMGFYKGTQENSIVIEIDGTEGNEQTIVYLAKKIKKLLRQECILIQRIESDSSII